MGKVVVEKTKGSKVLLRKKKKIDIDKEEEPVELKETTETISMLSDASEVFNTSLSSDLSVSVDSSINSGLMSPSF